MGFFKKLSSKSQEVAAKAKDTIDIMKLNSNISDEEKKKRNMYTEIGQKYVEMLGTDEECSFDEQIQNINISDEKIGEYRNKIAKIKKIKYCSQCGVAVHDDAVFCCRCGNKMPDENGVGSVQTSTDSVDNVQSSSDIEDNVDTNVVAPVEDVVEAVAVEQVAEVAEEEAVVEQVTEEAEEETVVEQVVEEAEEETVVEQVAEEAEEEAVVEQVVEEAEENAVEQVAEMTEDNDNLSEVDIIIEPNINESAYEKSYEDYNREIDIQA